MAGKTVCPLCGEAVSWSERQAGLYACLTVCVPAVRHPNHLVEKHPDYLSEAKRLARPVFYSAAFSTAIAMLSWLLGLMSFGVLAAFAAVGFFMVGWSRRVGLIRRHRSF
ncbi:MAG: hypothetical protein NZ921_02435 [Candidatus Caldarchaeum sp.]|nr:hypothetical protein [Candidatus Caldarchaeum sp.]